MKTTINRSKENNAEEISAEQTSCTATATTFDESPEKTTKCMLIEDDDASNQQILESKTTVASTTLTKGSHIDMGKALERGAVQVGVSVVSQVGRIIARTITNDVIAMIRKSKS